MGERGARLTGTATEVAGDLVDELEPLGNVTTKKMFGGVGVFGDGVMFVIIDSAGAVYLRAGDESVPKFEAAGSDKHGRMPYYRIPDGVLGDHATLVEWATAALEDARAAKK